MTIINARYVKAKFFRCSADVLGSTSENGNLDSESLDLFH
jgi:hypothetical protein